LSGVFILYETSPSGLHIHKAPKARGQFRNL
jgi:hypothetical protein